jgi:hypothetical protein
MRCCGVRNIGIKIFVNITAEKVFDRVTYPITVYNYDHAHTLFTISRFLATICGGITYFLTKKTS